MSSSMGKGNLTNATETKINQEGPSPIQWCGALVEHRETFTVYSATSVHSTAWVKATFTLWRQYSKVVVKPLEEMCTSDVGLPTMEYRVWETLQQL